MGNLKSYAEIIDIDTIPGLSNSPTWEETSEGCDFTCRWSRRADVVVRWLLRG
jgi:hypothetical protein